MLGAMNATAAPALPAVAWVTVDTPLPTGPMRFALTDHGIAASTYWDDPLGGLPSWEEPPSAPPPPERVALVRERVEAYFAGRIRELGLPVDWRLVPVAGPRRPVLRTLLETVPYGGTVTYGELATRSGAFPDPAAPLAPGAEPPARTVGTIMGANPLPLLIPCHRVVASDGLGGFGGGRRGIDVKSWLLTLEGVLQPTLDWNGPA